MLHSIPLSSLSENPDRLFRLETALLAAGTPERFNMMTVGWGGLGALWGMPMAAVFVRPSRYTLEFVDQNPLFALSFFGDGQKEALARLGSLSGRDIDKMNDSGLTPTFVDGAPAFSEARLVLVCRKMYRQTMDLSLVTDEYREKISRWRQCQKRLSS